MSKKDRAWHKRTGEMGYVLRGCAYLTSPIKFDFVSDDGLTRVVAEDEIVLIDEDKQKRSTLTRKWAKRKRK